jgi:hypothetical protein
MLHRWTAPLSVLALCAATPTPATGQSAQEPRKSTAGTLAQNFPNPFNPDTTIPFTIGDDTCVGSNERHSVTLKVFNVLAQLVAIPVLQSATIAGATGDPPAGKPLANLTLGCGSFQAFWDGKFMNTGRPAAAGVYVYQLIIDGRPVVVRKMVIAK